MSAESLEVMLARLNEDDGLQEKLKAATSLDQAVAIVNEAGFEITKYDFLEHKKLIGPHRLWEWSWI